MTTKNWNKDTIRELLAKNDTAVERAILAIFKRQTEDEQATSDTRHTNGRGFSQAHAKRGSHLAKWILSGRHLSGKFQEQGRKIAMRYARQLAEIAQGQ